MSDPTKPSQPRPRVKWWHIALLALAVLATLSLAYWQWTRFQSGSGTFQNLGYALQWPLFGAFFVFAYRKILEYENDSLDAEERGEVFEVAEKSTEIDPDFLPSRPQLNVEQYNELNRQRRGEN